MSLFFPLVQNHNKEQQKDKEFNIFILYMIYTSYILFFS